MRIRLLQEYSESADISQGESGHRRSQDFLCGVHFLLDQKSDDVFLVITLSYMIIYVIYCHQLPFYLICGGAPYQIQLHFCLSFAVSGPCVWNDLPPTLRVSPGTLRQFQGALKTILFCSAYGTT